MPPHPTGRGQMRAQSVAQRKPLSALSMREGELRAFLLIGDLVAAALGAHAAPLVWGAFDPDFGPRTDLRLYEVAFVATWMVVFRLFGGGDFASPRFGRRTLAAVART